MLTKILEFHPCRYSNICWTRCWETWPKLVWLWGESWSKILPEFFPNRRKCVSGSTPACSDQCQQSCAQLPQFHPRGFVLSLNILNDSLPVLMFSLPSQFCDSDLVAITGEKTEGNCVKTPQFPGAGNNSSEAIFRCGFWEVLTPTKFVSENFTFWDHHLRHQSGKIASYVCTMPVYAKFTCVPKYAIET